jgi:hypothetical protein
LASRTACTYIAFIVYGRARILYETMDSKMWQKTALLVSRRFLRMPRSFILTEC